MVGRKRRPMRERFERKFVRGSADECWLWLASTAKGYGVIWSGGAREIGKQLQAHRVAYEFYVGPIPGDLVIDHLCRNRDCVNPTHLEPVTMKENILRGEGPSAQQAKQTHCKRGHRFTEVNTIRRWNRNTRECRTCVQASDRKRYAEHGPRKPRAI